ncbi:recombinase family protein [Halobacillus sp. BBL2006]|uniref:recombinase family protein n=1 Tax=Halobacillus sp. BBL2006 TaxID=1543706 RepID=UPI00068ACADE|nr:recombinase family protein [Halobacillus sp. BBL2006]
MTIGVYIRVSTLEQAKEGYSISAQKERLNAYCSAQGWKDYKFFVDEGVSGKDTNRPQLQNLLDAMDQGKISMILVYRLDRFTRSVLDLHKMLERMDKHQCTFKSATEPYDTSTAMGRMFITIVAAMAQWEIENSSERIKMALEEKVSEGERVGNVPFGFDLSEREKLVKNEKAPIVLDMIEKIMGGMSAASVADFLTKTNNDKNKWLPNTVLRILRNPAIYGATRWNDKVYEDTHEGLISKEEFLKLQQILDSRTIFRKRHVKSTYLFQGVLICPVCNRPLSVNRYVRKKSDGTQYQGAIYRCQVCAKEGKYNKSIGEQRFLDALYSYMRNVKIDQLQSLEEEDVKTPVFFEQLKQIEKKREKYQRAWASDLMDDDEFKRLMEETKEPYEALKKKAQNYKHPEPIDLTAINEIIKSFNEHFTLLTLDEKRSFISTFIKKIEFTLEDQPPKAPHKSNKGKERVEITNVDFY